MAITNHERVGEAMELLRPGLAPFVEREIRNAHPKSPIREAARYVSDERLADRPIAPPKSRRVASRTPLVVLLAGPNGAGKSTTAHLFEYYLDAVDSWQVYDNAGVAAPRLVAARAAGSAPAVADAVAWENLKEKQR